MIFPEIQGLKFTSGNIVLAESAKESLENGTWETSEIQLCKKYLKPTDSILELGACLGVVSCVTNSMLTNPENHVVVEANPETAKILAVNREKNDAKFIIENCLVFRKHSGKFYPASGAPQSGSTIIHNDGLDKKEENQFEFDFVYLPVTTVDELEKKHRKDFNVLIMDVEGGEFQFIKENKRLLKTVELAIIEFHHRFDIEGCNQAEYEKAVEILEDCGLAELKNAVKIKGKTIETATEVWGRP